MGESWDWTVTEQNNRATIIDQQQEKQVFVREMIMEVEKKYFNHPLTDNNGVCVCVSWSRLTISSTSQFTGSLTRQLVVRPVLKMLNEIGKLVRRATMLPQICRWQHPPPPTSLYPVEWSLSLHAIGCTQITHQHGVLSVRGASVDEQKKDSAGGGRPFLSGGSITSFTTSKHTKSSQNSGEMSGGVQKVLKKIEASGIF